MFAAMVVRVMEDLELEITAPAVKGALLNVRVQKKNDY